MTDHLAEARRLARLGRGGDFGRNRDLAQAIEHLVAAIAAQPKLTPNQRIFRAELILEQLEEQWHVGEPHQRILLAMTNALIAIAAHG